MKIVSSTTALLISLMFLSACTRKLEVDVFIVTKGGENIKLGLVEISAIPYDDAVKALQPVVAERKARRDTSDAASRTAHEKYTAIKDGLAKSLEVAVANEPKTREAAYAAMMKFESTAREAATAAEKYEQSIKEKHNYDYMDPAYEKIRNELAPFPLTLILAEFQPSKYPDESSMESVPKVLDIVNRKAWEGIPQHRAAVLEAAARLKAV